MAFYWYILECPVIGSFTLVAARESLLCSLQKSFCSKPYTYSLEMILSVGQKCFWVKVTKSRNLTFAFKKYEKTLWLQMLARFYSAHKQQVWERNAAVSITVKWTAKTSAMPIVTPITVDIFETEIEEFYVLIQSTKMFNVKMQLLFKIIKPLNKLVLQTW